MANSSARNYMEIALGDPRDEKQCEIYDKFCEQFKQYIAGQTGFNTVYLNEAYWEDEATHKAEILSFIKENGLTENDYLFQ